MSKLDAWKLIPPASTSVTLEKNPSYLETSVDVPPMSKPIIESSPFISPTVALPIAPPAGPDNIASLPVNDLPVVSPPELCINSRGISPNSPFKDRIYLLRIG